MSASTNTTTPWWDDLPDEYWYLILTSLTTTTHHHHHHLDSISLVNKRFLSITNSLKTHLNITYPTTPTTLLHRFSNLKHITIGPSLVSDHVDDVVGEVARSGVMGLESLKLVGLEKVPSRNVMRGLGGGGVGKGLKCLGLREMKVLYDKDLIVVVKYFVGLEELDISYPGLEGRVVDRFERFPVFVSDSGIDALSLNLPSLRKINLSGNPFITDQSLASLSLNCIFLREIAARDCPLISQSGIGLAIRQNPNLICLSVSRTNGIPYPPSPITIENSLFSARCLSVLDLSRMSISDKFLFSVGEAILPLKKLVLSHCLGYTFVGTLYLLEAYPSLNHLDLEGADFLTDQNIDLLSNYLHCLTYINLNLCSNLTNSTFSTLAMKCAYLEEIRMERTSLGKEELKTSLNSRIVTLKLGRNEQLTDKTLREIACSCPNLKLLDTSHNLSITEEVIKEIGKFCCEIRELELNKCPNVTSLGSSKFSKLEVFRAQGSLFNDLGLSMMGKNCLELFCLNLEGCSEVTEKGVKELVYNCKKLRELNLKNCCNVNVGILAWIVFSRRSLRKIIPPAGFTPTYKQREMFLRHGCMVFDG